MPPTSQSRGHRQGLKSEGGSHAASSTSFSGVYKRVPAGHRRPIHGEDSSGLAPLIVALEAMGFVRDDAQPQPSWDRLRLLAVDGAGLRGLRGYRGGDGARRSFCGVTPECLGRCMGMWRAASQSTLSTCASLIPSGNPSASCSGHIDKGFVFESAKTGSARCSPTKWCRGDLAQGAGVV